jgi:hypothetical protein
MDHANDVPFAMDTMGDGWADDAFVSDPCSDEQAEDCGESAFGCEQEERSAT